MSNVVPIHATWNSQEGRLELCINPGGPQTTYTYIDGKTKTDRPLYEKGCAKFMDKIEEYVRGPNV